MRISIKVRGGALVRQGLENIHLETPQVGRRRVRTVLNRIVRRMQEYPEERPGSTYHRTGNLFYHWKIEPLSKIGYSISNTATRKGRAYPQYVVGDAYGISQAWMHKGRWPLFRDVTEEELLALPQEILDDLMLVARREEFKTNEL